MVEVCSSCQVWPLTMFSRAAAILTRPDCKSGRSSENPPEIARFLAIQRTDRPFFPLVCLSLCAMDRPPISSSSKRRAAHDPKRSVRSRLYIMAVDTGRRRVFYRYIPSSSFSSSLRLGHFLSSYIHARLAPVPVHTTPPATRSSVILPTALPDVLLEGILPCIFPLILSLLTHSSAAILYQTPSTTLSPHHRRPFTLMMMTCTAV